MNNSHAINLRVENLSVFRSDLPLFEPISFTLGNGECVQIGGTNGAGKTSFLRCLCELSRRYEGNIFWNNEDVTSNTSDFYSNLLYIGHGLGLKPKLTVEQNLSFYQQLRFPLNRALLKDALEQLKVDMYFDEFVGNLSAGQKRRVALARLITESVKIWVLDEPMVALDHEGQSWLEAVSNQHLASGGMVVLTSHQKISNIKGLRMLTLKEARLELSSLADKNP